MREICRPSGFLWSNADSASSRAMYDFHVIDDYSFEEFSDAAGSEEGQMSWDEAIELLQNTFSLAEATWKHIQYACTTCATIWLSNMLSALGMLSTMHSLRKRWTLSRMSCPTGWLILPRRPGPLTCSTKTFSRHSTSFAKLTSPSLRTPPG